MKKLIVIVTLLIVSFVGALKIAAQTTIEDIRDENKLRTLFNNLLTDYSELKKAESVSDSAYNLLNQAALNTVKVIDCAVSNKSKDSIKIYLHNARRLNLETEDKKKRAIVLTDIWHGKFEEDMRIFLNEMSRHFDRLASQKREQSELKKE